MTQDDDTAALVAAARDWADYHERLGDAEHQRMFTRLAAALKAAQADKARLREALEPFVRNPVSGHAGDIPDLWLLSPQTPVRLMRQSPSRDGWQYDKDVVPPITIADVQRAARAALGDIND